MEKIPLCFVEIGYFIPLYFLKWMFSLVVFAEMKSNWLGWIPCEGGEVYSEEEEGLWVIWTRTMVTQPWYMVEEVATSVVQDHGDPCNVLKSTGLGWVGHQDGGG